MFAIGFLLVAPAGNSLFAGVTVPTPVGNWIGPITFIGLTLLWISAWSRFIPATTIPWWASATSSEDE